MQRVGSDDGRHSFGSVALRFGRVTHAPADPRALYRAIRRLLLHRLGRRPGAPKWVPGWCGGQGRWQAALCSSWTRLSTSSWLCWVVLGDRAALGQGCRRAHCCPSGGLRGLLPGRALHRFAEQIIVKAWYTVLKTVEFRSCSS